MTPSTHFEALLEHDLDLIRAKLLEMAALDGRALSQALEAFLRTDRQLAYSVILSDRDVDALDADLDRRCLEFLVRHVPAGGHLRFVYAASKVVTCLERIGDYAESVARQVVVLSGIPGQISLATFGEIARLAIPMVHAAVQAFVDKNVDLARATMAIEPRVNEVRDALNTELVERRSEGQIPVDALPPLLTVARRFERVSDQATNICEETVYSATGRYARHAPPAGFQVLFVDDRHNCLSRMAEAIGGALLSPRVSFSSAGLSAGPIDPGTAAFLAERGLQVPARAPRAFSDIPETEPSQVVVALCSEARQVRPRRPTKALGLDWPMPDPSTADGTPDEVHAAYAEAFAALSRHIHDLVQAIIGNDQHSLL